MKRLKRLADKKQEAAIVRQHRRRLARQSKALVREQAKSSRR